MEYKYFRWHVLTRITLLLLLGYSAIYVLIATHFWLVSFWIILAWIIVLISLIRYIEKSHRELAYFLLAIKQGDFTNTYHFQQKSDLNYAFNEINNVMKRLSQEKASNLLYLQTVVKHVRVAVICLDEEYRVKLFNQAAQRLFQKKQVGSIKSIESISPAISEAIQRMRNGEKELIKVNIEGRLFNLSMLVTEFKLKNESYKLASFQDIKSELEAKEIESWQKLIRVLTHEIKNSVIPISTLSEVLLQMLRKDDGSVDLSQLDRETVEDIVGGIETIENRSKGLAHFVSSYDQLTKIPEPKLQPTEVYALVQQTVNLFKADFASNNIHLEVNSDKHSLLIDADLIEQVLINLVKNAIEAIHYEANPNIKIELKQEEQAYILSISDNGPGITEEVLENIFIPFYTTKEKGSGIGLSLSRQIMRLHKGTLNVETSNSGTTFHLQFPITSAV